MKNSSDTIGNRTRDWNWLPSEYEIGALWLQKPDNSFRKTTEKR
jgi:hypothetical protein